MSEPGPMSPARRLALGVTLLAVLLGGVWLAVEVTLAFDQPGAVAFGWIVAVCALTHLLCRLVFRCPYCGKPEAYRQSKSCGGCGKRIS